MVKNGNNIAIKGIKHGLPYYECDVCHMPFTLSNVIRLENKVGWEREPDWFDPAFASPVSPAGRLDATWAWIKKFEVK